MATDDPNFVSTVGKINTFDCPNGHQLVTIDVDEGVQSRYIQCEVCGLAANSNFYKVPDGLTPMAEFYKPKYPERFTDAALKNHLLAGGLALREIGALDESLNLKAVLAPKTESFSKKAMKSLTNSKK